MYQMEKFADPKIVIFARRNEIEPKALLCHGTAIADFRNISGTLRVYFYDPSVSDSRWCRREERWGEGRGRVRSVGSFNPPPSETVTVTDLFVSTLCGWTPDGFTFSTIGTMGTLITYLMVNKCLSVQVLDKQNKMATQHKMVDGLGFPRIVDGRARTQELQHCSRGTAARANLSRRGGDHGPLHRPIGPPPPHRTQRAFWRERVVNNARKAMGCGKLENYQPWTFGYPWLMNWNGTFLNLLLM